MEEEGPMAIWKALVCETDDEDFHGFTVEEVKKGLMLIQTLWARVSLAFGQIAVRQHFQ